MELDKSEVAGDAGDDSEAAVLTIKIPKKNPSGGSELTAKQLEDQVEVQPDYLKFLYGTWVKSVNKNTNKFHSGGFLSKIEDGKAVLRRCKTFEEVDIKSHYFYTRNSSEQYKAIQEITLAYEKLKYDKYIFEQEKMKKNEILRRMYETRKGP